MSSIFTGQKMADMSKVGLLLGGGICHITATQVEVKEVPACVRKYCFNALIFSNISSACTKEYLNCCKVLMLSWSWSLRSNSGGYLRDCSPQWTPFFSPFPVVTQSANSTGLWVYVHLQANINTFVPTNQQQHKPITIICCSSFKFNLKQKWTAGFGN